MKPAFKRIILYARQHRANQGVSETLQRLVTFLQAVQQSVFIDIDTAASFATIDLPVLPRSEMGLHGDLIVVVGGDGSLLSAARMAITVNVPVIGINRGRLGFLTDISPQDMEVQLKAVFQGLCQEEHRFLLQTRIHDADTTYFEALALNDVVLGRGSETHLIEFDVFINQQLVSYFRSDGMILSTPTGSTAYCLSAGGPIMHPRLDAIVLVPMFSHSLSSRPLVVNGDTTIDLHISTNNECALPISCDGHESHLVKPGQVVTITQYPQQLRLLHPVDYHYYETLRIKLGWGSTNQG